MTISDSTYRVVENEWITLEDGTRLAARIWLPNDSGSRPVPAVLEYLPYKKRGGSDARDDQTYAYFARHGYAGIRVDIRGNGESGGHMEDEYTVEELNDGVEVIKWIAGQDWCDGNVGMIGISWGGFNGLQIAALRPPSLKAIITICSTDDRYADDIHFMGGCLLNDNLTWSQQMLALSSRPPDPDLIGENWRALWLERLEALPFLAANWLKHPRRDAFWKHGSVCEDFGAIEAAVLAVGGWHDAYSNAIPRLLSGLKAPAKGIIGPWEHRYPHLAKVGPAIDFLKECVRWWDRWLKGDQNGVDSDPALRAYLLKSAPPCSQIGYRDGLWVGEECWPPLDASSQKFYLAPGKLTVDPPGPGLISVSTPLDLGLAAGNFCPGMRVDNELSEDQRLDDEKAVVFDGETLTEELAILGAPTVAVAFSCDFPDAKLVARLCDVAPDGSSTRVSLAAFNLTHWNSHETPTALEPGEIYKVHFKLSDAGYIFAKGHRIRLALSTSYWPLLWPSAEMTSIELVAGASSLTLPLTSVDNRAVVSFEAPGALPSGVFEAVRAAKNSKCIDYDVSGAVKYEIQDDLGQTRNLVTGLETGSTVRHSYWIDPVDPLSARTEAAWTFETRRGNWEVSTQTSSLMTCDETHFHLIAKLEAFENGEAVFEKTWQESIEREHL